MASYFEPLIMAAIGTASKILSSQQQMAVLDQTKTLTESALQMLYTAKEAGGNPKVLKLQLLSTPSCQWEPFCAGKRKSSNQLCRPLKNTFNPDFYGLYTVVYICVHIIQIIFSIF